MPLNFFNDKFYGVWIMGYNYGHRSKFYGKYPHSLKRRIKSLFPNCNNILHLFSGEIKDHLTYDINPDLQPMICDDVRNIGKYSKVIREIDLVIADPPYDKLDFQKYGQKPFNKWRVVRELGEMMKKGSFLVWLDIRVPMYSKKLWHLIGYIAIVISTNQRIRCLSFFKKYNWWTQFDGTKYCE